MKESKVSTLLSMTTEFEKDILKESYQLFWLRSY